MQDLFVDDIRSIFVANGVVRIEFGRLKRSEDEPNKVASESTATVLMPYNALKNMMPRLAKAVHDVERTMQQDQRPHLAADNDRHAEEALSNL